MKRELLQNVKVIPYTSGEVLDRSGFLSAVLGIKVSSVTGDPDTCKVILKIEHGDSAAGDFTSVTDEMIALGETTMSETIGTLNGIPVEAGESINVDLDLLGCKDFIKITSSFEFDGGTTPAATASYAVALGDKNISPV